MNFRLLIILVLINVVWSKNNSGQTTTFVKGFNGISPSSIVQTFDGGYFLTGHTGFLTNWNTIGIVKLNALGNLEWAKEIHSVNRGIPMDAIEMSDSGFIVLASCFNYQNIPDSGDIHLIRLNKFGDTLWTKNIGSPADDFPTSFASTSDGGFVISGFTGGFGNQLEQFILKTDSAGKVLWTKCYLPHTNFENVWFRKIIEASDGGLLVCGRYSNASVQTWNAMVMKTDSIGNMLWSREYGSTQWSETADGWDIIETMNNDLVFVAAFSSFDTIINGALIAKTDSIGNLQWGKLIGGPTGFTFPGSLEETSDSGYMVSCLTDAFSRSGDGYLIRLNSAGDTLWTRGYAGSNIATSVYAVCTNDDGFALFGGIQFAGNEPTTLIKTDSSGRVSGCEYNPHSLLDNLSWYSTVLLSDTNIIFALHDYTTFSDPLPIVPTTYCFVSDVKKIKYEEATLFPNPTSGRIRIKLNQTVKDPIIRVFNPIGQECFNTVIETESSAIDLNVNFLKEGIYLLLIENSTERFKSTLIKY